MLARTPEPPYVAVIFTSTQTDDLVGYAEMASRMEALAAEQPGYLGFESARAGPEREARPERPSEREARPERPSERESCLGIAVSYWATDDDARAWKQVVDHAEAQRLGRERWYSAYRVRVARVEREYGFDR